MEYKKKILFVENEILNDNPMSTCYQIKCNKIKNITDEKINIKYYNIGSSEELDFSQYEIVLFGCRSIYLYKIYKGKTKENLKIKFENIVNKIDKKFFIIQDMHQKTYGSIEELCKILNNYNFNIIFTFFNNSEAKLIKKLTPLCTYHHLPHHIDTNIFKKYDEITEKSIDILLFGSVHPKHYPFRKRLFDLILENKEKFTNVYYIEYNSGVFNPEHCEVGLSKLLNKSKICIGTKSRYDYLVGKYFEISSSNCLIAGDIPTDGKNLLKNNILELSPSMTDDKIIESLKNCCENYDLFNDKIHNLKKIVDNQYNLDKYIDKLILILLS